MDIAGNLSLIRQRIQSASARSGRDPSSIALLAVTKNRPPDMIRAAAEAGLDLFGENRVQEAKAKIPLCPGGLRWHMIGHLQSNKARDAAHLFDMIQSVGSLELARELQRRAEQLSKTVPVLLEVNVAGEASKHGYQPALLPRELPRLNALNRVEIHGLMTVAPWSTEPEKVRPIFRRLRELKEQCEEILGAPLSHLSMGMSGDYEIAVEEGATLVRIGTALFGPRPPVATASRAAAEA